MRPHLAEVSFSKNGIHRFVVLPTLSFITAFFLGSIFTSLMHSYTFISKNGNSLPTWQMLSSIGAFWNGHFGALSLIAVAWAFYFQLIKSRLDAHEREERANAAEAEMREMRLSHLETRRTEIARWIKFSMAWMDDLGNWHIECTGGADVLARSLPLFQQIGRESGYDDCLLRVTLNEIQKYHDSLCATDRLIYECDSHHQEQLRLTFDVSREMLACKPLLDHLSEVVGTQMALFEKLTGESADTETKQAFARAVEDGWNFYLRIFGDIKVIEARCLTFDGALLECQIVISDSTAQILTSELIGLLSSIESGRFSKCKIAN